MYTHRFKILRFSLIQHNRYYVISVNCCFFVVPFFLIIITLTLDRFMEVHLNIKYHLYFNATKVRCILVANWIVGAVLGTVLITLRALRGTKILTIVYLVIFPCLEIVFLCVATVTYAYIYSKFRSKFKRLFLGKVSPCSMEQQSTNKNNNNKSYIIRSDNAITSRNNNIDNSKRNSLWEVTKRTRKAVVFNGLGSIQHNNTTTPATTATAARTKRGGNIVFKRRNFFAPSLIVLSFILFVIIPDVLNLFVNYLGMIQDSAAMQHALLCLYSAGFITDGVVYIFLQKHVRTMLMKMFHRKKWIVQHVDFMTSAHATVNETSR